MRDPLLRLRRVSVVGVTAVSAAGAVVVHARYVLRGGRFVRDGWDRRGANHPLDHTRR